MSDPAQTFTSASSHDEDPDAPMTLEEACRVIFRGAIKPATLLAEARRGRLVMERVGRRNFVTRAGIKAMREACEVRREQCHVPAKAHAYGSIARPASGSSAMERSNAALDAALASAVRRKSP